MMMIHGVNGNREDGVQLYVRLSPEHGEKLGRIARRINVAEGTLAGSLLSHAIDQADLDQERIVDLLDRIPGSRHRIEAGIADALAGRTVPFDQR
jgi:predicted transcriptional regulator